MLKVLLDAGLTLNADKHRFGISNLYLLAIIFHQALGH
jgi:hypothetical protein